MSEMDGLDPSMEQSRVPTVAERWRRFSASYLRAAAGGLLGAIAGAAYAHFVGCRTGTCPLTSSIWSAGTFGGLVGAVVGWPTRVRPRGGERTGPGDGA